MIEKQRHLLSEDEVMAELRADTPLNKLRRKFSSWSAKIERAQQQRQPIGPIEVRRMEFEAVLELTEMVKADHA